MIMGAASHVLWTANVKSMVTATATANTAPRAGERARIVGGLAVTLLMWASAFVVIRSAGRHLSPGPLALSRIAVGSLALGIAMVVRRQAPPGRGAMGRAALAGVLWFGAYMLSLNAAERWVDAGTSSLLVNMGPLFIALLAGWLLHEGFPRPLLGGCVLAFSGAGVIALSASGHGTHELLGAGLCVLAAALYAAGVVAQKPALRYAPALPVTWLACTVGADALLGCDAQAVHERARASAARLAGAVYLGLGPTATAFLLWAYVLAQSDAG